MYSISEAAERVGVSAHTLRYYEKIGLVPSPERRQSGMRLYSDRELKMLQCLTSMRKMGMSLEALTEFFHDGCIMKRLEEEQDVTVPVQKRVEILGKHLRLMERQMAELEQIIEMTKDKILFYESLSSGAGEEEEG